MLIFFQTGEYNSVPWIVPVIAGVFLSTSILLIFVAYLNYLTDTYLMFAASALAANTVARSACGAASPLFTQYMFNALGVGGGGSLIAGIAFLLAPIPFIFYKYGGPIRERSKFAPTPTTRPDVEKEIPEEQDIQLSREHTMRSSRPSRANSRANSQRSGTYAQEGVGLDRVASINDARTTDVAQHHEHNRVVHAGGEEIEDPYEHESETEAASSSSIEHKDSNDRV